jgi:hypothetical protein
MLVVQQVSGGCGLLSMSRAKVVVMFLKVFAEVCGGNLVGKVEGMVAAEVCVCVSLEAEENTKCRGRSTMFIIASSGQW